MTPSPPPELPTSTTRGPLGATPPPELLNSPHGGARSHKRIRSRSPPASPTPGPYSHRFCFHRRRHNSPGPSSRRSRYPEHRHVRHRRCMSPSSSHHERRQDFPLPAPPLHVPRLQPPPPLLPVPQRQNVHHHRTMSASPPPHQTAPSFPFTAPPVRVFEPQPQPPPLEDLQLGVLPSPDPPQPRLLVSPRSAGARTLGEVGWGIERCSWVHLTHTLEKILTRIADNPNETAPEAVMPPRAWGTHLRDVVQGLRPLYTPESLR